MRLDNFGGKEHLKSLKHFRAPGLTNYADYAVISQITFKNIYFGTLLKVRTFTSDDEA